MTFKQPDLRCEKMRVSGVDFEIPSAKVSTSLWQDALCAQAGLNAEHTALHFGAVCPTLRGRHSRINMLHKVTQEKLKLTQVWTQVIFTRNLSD